MGYTSTTTGGYTIQTTGHSHSSQVLLLQVLKGRYLPALYDPRGGSKEARWTRKMRRKETNRTSMFLIREGDPPSIVPHKAGTQPHRDDTPTPRRIRHTHTPTPRLRLHLRLPPILRIRTCTPRHPFPTTPCSRTPRTRTRTGRRNTVDGGIIKSGNPNALHIHTHLRH